MYPEADGASADANPSMLSHDRVGRYELLRPLGSGGMAEVHLARASGVEGFEKLVVLKRILPHLSADRHFVRMFLEEAKLAAILDHSNVVQVFDLGFDGDDFFFTMEFVYGENLQSILRAARRRDEEFPFEHAISICAGVAAGLHYAHERIGFDGRQLGIVHRDVSPTNVMITYDGCPKVADFGIAKVVTRTDVTRAGMRKGKVPYMSPEQCRAEKIDRRSDVFSLGIVLYEATTMTRLFDGDNEFGVMNRIVNGDIPLPSTRRPGYPKDLERIVMRALAIDREARYRSAREMQLDLERYARERKLRINPSALSEWMHLTFKPQPFPWGALLGGGVTGAPATASTLAEFPQQSSSVSAPAYSRPDITPHSQPSMRGRSSASVSAFSSHQKPRRSGTLRGLAIGLSVVAALAVIGAGGLYVAKHRVELLGDPGSEAAVEPAESAPAAQAESPGVAPAGASPEAPSAEPNVAPPPPPEADALPDPEPVEEPPAEEEEPSDEAEPEEDLTVLEEDPIPRKKPRAKKPKKPAEKKPADKKPGGKKPNLDSFMPGAG